MVFGSARLHPNLLLSRGFPRARTLHSPQGCEMSGLAAGFRFLTQPFFESSLFLARVSRPLAPPARATREESPDTTEQRARRKTGRRGRKPAATDSVTENTPAAFGRPRVKWRGKSPPPRWRHRGHEKPRAVQDKAGACAARASAPGISRTTGKPGSRRKAGREMAAPAARRKPARRNRIRLTALATDGGAPPKRRRPVSLRATDRRPGPAGRRVSTPALKTWPFLAA